MNTPRHFTLLVALFATFSLYPSSFCLAQGSLTPPPGAPVPTMKTLDQVEARTPISSAPSTISTSGSYYLTGNLTVSSGNGITVNADNVTLDLNGFTIASTASPAAGAGVLLGGVRRNVTVKNGHIRGNTTFASGTFTPLGFLDGVENPVATSTNLRISEVTVSGVGDAGISMILVLPSSKNVVERCAVSICGGIGIRAGRVAECHVDTAGSFGILADVVSHSVSESAGTVSSDAGISASTLVEHCRGIAVAGNGVTTGGQASHCFGTSSSGIGLSADSAVNCQGISTSGAGISAGTALNCQGSSTTGAAGLAATTASFCRAQRDGGNAINAAIAIGCTALGTGVVNTVPANKFLGTP